MRLKNINNKHSTHMKTVKTYVLCAFSRICAIWCFLNTASDCMQPPWQLLLHCFGLHCTILCLSIKIYNWKKKSFTYSHCFCTDQSVGITICEETAKSWTLLTSIVAVFPWCCSVCIRVVAFASGLCFLHPFFSISFHVEAFVYMSFHFHSCCGFCTSSNTDWPLYTSLKM